MKYIKQVFQKVTKKECVEFGLVLVVVIALIGLYKKNYHYLVTVAIISLFTVILPLIFYPFAVFWFGLSRILNAVSSRLLLTVIFFLIVTPVGIIRRITGYDSMKIKQFKKSNESVLVTRDHIYLPEDLLHTF